MNECFAQQWENLDYKSYTKCPQLDRPTSMKMCLGECVVRIMEKHGRSLCPTLACDRPELNDKN